MVSGNLETIHQQLNQHRPAMAPKTFKNDTFWPRGEWVPEIQKQYETIKNANAKNRNNNKCFVFQLWADFIEIWRAQRLDVYYVAMKNGD